MKPHEIRSLLAKTYAQWSEHSAPRLGAALAYYALLSVSPLAILTVALVGLIVNRSSAESRVLDQIRVLLGSQAAKTLQVLIDDAQHRGTGIIATAVAIITLLFGASGVFGELRYALNVIWEVPPNRKGGWRSTAGDKLISFAMVVGCGLFLLASVLISTGFAVAAKFADSYVPIPAALMAEGLNLFVSLLLLTLLFAILYKTVPNVYVDWHEVGIGAFFTAVLFVIGKGLLALYLTKAAVGSAYGAAGSLVAFVVWVYYSAQIFFFGAVFTHVYAQSRVPLLQMRSAATLK